MAQGFAWTLAAACLALVLIAAAHYYSIYRSGRILQETAERVNLELVRQVVLADVNTVVTDLFVLARHIEQMPLQNAGEADPHLERVFVIFAEQKRLYDQIRFIDPQGRETLRVNFANGRASIWTLIPVMFQSAVTLLSGGGHSPTREYPPDQARDKFNADWAAAAAFDVIPELEADHRQGLLLALHKNNLADAYVIFLFDDHEVVRERVNASLGALRFIP
jgi:hypothetical protein